MAETISNGEPTVLSRETRDLEELERIIGHGLGTFVEVGRALLEIQHRRLYLQAGYRSFAVYTSERWDLSESHAYRQIEAAKVIDVLSPTGESLLPANEAQAPELVPLVGDPDAIRAVWSEIERSGEARNRASDPRESGRTARTSPDDPLALRLHDFACLPSLRAHLEGPGWLDGMRRGTNAQRGLTALMRLGT
jgi:hypothetical protein